MKYNCNVNVIKENLDYIYNPTKIFNYLCAKKHFTLLLESSETNTKNSLESIIILQSALYIKSFGNIVLINALNNNGLYVIKFIKKNISKKIKIKNLKYGIKLMFPNVINIFNKNNILNSISVLDAIRYILKSIKCNKKHSKSIFLGGLFSYDLINNFEKLPILKRNNNCPDFCFYLSESLLILDHVKKKCIVQGSIFSNSSIEFKRIYNYIKKVKKKLKKNIPKILHIKKKNFFIKENINDKNFEKLIIKLHKKIIIGEIFQIVISRKYFIHCYNPLFAYEILKITNPSPYMFFIQDKEFTLFGASPESALKYNPISNIIEIYPIAGTRPRGFSKDGNIDLDLDNKIELEMITNKKELSEHIMLVDLARNDLSKICKFGTRYVKNLLQVDKYSHVMHLVSKVVGKLKKNLDILHAYQACMNMGTLTGSPKVKAMRIIYNYEITPRGSYGGSVGYITGSGWFDTCITIRSAYVENKIATVQVGVGIVQGSIPKDEIEESKNKSKAIINAIIKSNN